MPLKSVVGQTGAVLSQHLGLRHRYVFTKNNRLRLRYLALMTAATAAGLPTFLVFSPMTDGGVHFEIASPAQAYNYIEPAAGVSGETVAALQPPPPAADVDFVTPAHGLSLAALAPFEQPLGPSERVVTISEGDALGKVMQKEGVPGEEVHEIIEAIDEHFDPRDLKIGQDISMNFQPDQTESGYRLDHLKIQINPLKTVVVSRKGDTFESAVEEKEVKPVIHAQKATIKTSLYGSAAKAGIPQAVVADAIKIYSQNIDFQRDVKSGDSLEVMYETMATDDGYVARTGNILFARLTLSGREIPLYRFEMADGGVDYFGPNGESTKKTLMRTPINGARLSSGFGMRRHPVLGYSKMHKGIDFAAPTGTPIYAAGDGVIERAGRFSSYGNYVKIRHRNDLHTAYAHLSKIKVRNGQRVRQGDVIGYVGTTGRSTGPHLHYEVLVNRKHVNPRSVNLPIGQALAGKDIKRFKSFVQEVNNQYAALLNKGSVNVAQTQVQQKPDSLN